MVPHLAMCSSQADGASILSITIIILSVVSRVLDCILRGMSLAVLPDSILRC